MNPGRLIAVGFVMTLAGAVLPFLMVIGVIDASLFLSALSYASSVGGLMFGLLGAATFANSSG